MTETVITCPNCSHPIPLTDALTGQIRRDIEAGLRLEEEQRVRAAVAAAETRAKDQSEQELRLLREQLAEQQRKTHAAQDAELVLRKDKAALEERQRELDLEVARKVDAEKQRLEESIRRTVGEEQSLKVKEKDKQIDGVWVASLRAWPALAVALRGQLIQVAFAHAASEGKNEKMELMYRYLAGDQFRGRVQGIVEAFTELQDQVNRERRAMERLWKEREKQIERMITNTVGMYGEMRGIVGATMPEIPALTLEGVAGLLEARE